MSAISEHLEKSNALGMVETILRSPLRTAIEFTRATDLIKDYGKLGGKFRFIPSRSTRCPSPKLVSRQIRNSVCLRRLLQLLLHVVRDGQDSLEEAQIASRGMSQTRNRKRLTVVFEKHCRFNSKKGTGLIQ